MFYFKNRQKESDFFERLRQDPELDIFTLDKYFVNIMKNFDILASFRFENIIFQNSIEIDVENSEAHKLNILMSSYSKLKPSWDHQKLRIATIKNNTFEKTTYLTTLNLCYINLKSIEPFVFSSLVNLTHLDLYDNLLKMLPNQLFQGLRNLKHLNLSENRLETLDMDLFNDLINLEFLDLRLNKLRRINKEVFKGLRNLKQLFLGNCGTSLDNSDYYKKVYIEPENFKYLESLITLDLSSNYLAEINSDFFSGLKELSKLNLSNNQIKYIKNGTFDNLPNLKTLYLCGNRLNNKEDETGSAQSFKIVH